MLNVINTVQTVTVHLWIGDDFTGCKTVEIMASDVMVRIQLRCARLQDLQGNVVTINEQELIQLGVNTKFQVISALLYDITMVMP